VQAWSRYEETGDRTIWSRDEIARMLRLRTSAAGVIDFIRYGGWRAHQRDVENRLRDALRVQIAHGYKPENLPLRLAGTVAPAPADFLGEPAILLPRCMAPAHTLHRILGAAHSAHPCRKSDEDGTAPCMPRCRSTLPTYLLNENATNSTRLKPGEGHGCVDQRDPLRVAWPAFITVRVGSGLGEAEIFQKWRFLICSRWHSHGAGWAGVIPCPRLAPLPSALNGGRRMPLPRPEYRLGSSLGKESRLFSCRPAAA